ncbi:MAG TPA: acetyl-CoA hydrolase/transferase C-terminal domain-containing protein [Dermatophilaceae bacterium]|jgi:acyl-CoA hydrolase|nr:acetyl-CoA hydrolase [Actinomycetales bacterium]HMT88572.1 acetyl-CoA hydrolase/transferase C-terminal domain-containing protein [Dermatophilaceae bacterium]
MSATLGEIVAMLESLPPNPRIVASGNAAIPFEMLRIIDQTLPEFTLNMLAAHAGLPMREGITHETSFVGAGMRKSPRLAYVPARLSMVPLLFSRTLLPDAVVAHTSLPHNGKVSLGIEANVMVGAIEACKARGGKIIAQANAKMPYTFGDSEYDVEDFDAIYEVDLPIASNARRPKVEAATGDAAVIGELVSSRVHDGATLQLGIGMVPDATLPFLAKLKGLGIWSEMFSDGVLSLIDAGAMDPERKITASFAAGSAELYEWMHLNPQVLMLRTETTNDPAAIAKQPQMTSINTALQVDLFGQANASRINARIFSGFGGQTDFIVGALHSPGGQAIMALRSWHPKAQVSTIVPLIEEPVTSFQHSAIITEQGIAEIFGNDQAHQCWSIINKAAHPSVRSELWEEAHALGLA